MKMTKKAYCSMASKRAKGSPVLKNCVWAFLVGGALCALAQQIIAWVQAGGLEEKEARLVGSLSLIALSVLLTACKIFDNIARRAGAGTIVPITGFANSMASTAQEFKSEGLVLGLGAKMFTIAGPVLVYGISASVIYGIIYWITTLF